MAIEETNKFPLSDIIINLREEILKAQQKAVGQELKFSVENIEVELQVGVTAKATAKGGVKFWVYSAEAGAEVAKQTMQKVKLTLKPSGKDGKTIEISDVEKMPKKRA